MNKKISFPVALIIIIVLAVLVGLIIWKYNFIPEFQPFLYGNNSPTEFGNDCDKLEKEIKDLLKEVNYCEEDSDCVAEWGYYCPFGCYKFYNRNADLSKIDKKVKIYNENCIRCEYLCQQPPKLEEIKCIEKMCVDIRFK